MSAMDNACNAVPATTNRQAGAAGAGLLPFSEATFSAAKQAKEALVPHVASLQFPFRGKRIGVTTDPEHHRGIDCAKEVMIPLSGHPGAFGKVRQHHTHEGVDLYCPEGEPVYAMERGTVVSVIDFTGPEVGMPWWNDTMAVFVEGEHGVINYGEITPREGLRPGDTVEQGDCIGSVKMVLKKDKGRPRTMLHLEFYVSGTRRPATWKVLVPKQVGAEKPEPLRDPTPLLLEAAGITDMFT